MSDFATESMIFLKDYTHLNLKIPKRVYNTPTAPTLFSNIQNLKFLDDIPQNTAQQYGGEQNLLYKELTKSFQKPSFCCSFMYNIVHI